ncbi:hypothetical protein [Limnobacter sp.]|uniref:hypothetical protein n=1 Tax=Limnobacter sp. TaxID=2003368 RepID=UPI0025B9911C|nr:hypothetical protein [Limnobacter sp.]
MTVQPGTYNITLQRRADYNVLLQFKDSTGTAIDITGYTVAAQVWDKARTTKSADFSITYTDRPNGEVTLGLTGTQTEAFPDQELYYDVLVTDTGGVKSYYLEGIIFIQQGYTG